MNMRKKMIVCAAFLISLFSFPAAYAQKSFVVGHDSVRMKKIWDEKRLKLKTDLQLTDEQADSLEIINLAFQWKRDTVLYDYHLDTRDKFAHYEVLMQAMNERLKAALGDDLFAKYEEWLHEHNPNRKN